MYFSGAYKTPSTALGLLGTVILICFIFLGIKAFKTKNRGYLILSDALKTGIGIAMIGGILSGIWNLALTTVIDPNFNTEVLAAQREKTIADNPEFTTEQIDQMLAIAEKIQSPPITFALAIIGSLFFGFIFSLIIGLILQKKEELY